MSHESLHHLNIIAMWYFSGFLRSLRFLHEGGAFSLKKVMPLQIYFFSSVPIPDLQSQFVNPRIHNLLSKLVSVSQPTKIHESKFKIEKVHDIKLLSDSELRAVNILFIIA